MGSRLNCKLYSIASESQLRTDCGMGQLATHEELPASSAQEKKKDGLPASSAQEKKKDDKILRSASESLVTFIKDVDAAVCDSKDTLSIGHLLEWMDAASCLAAEKHCGRSAVTLVMDDLDFTDDFCELLSRGERCILEGKVTRAFGSSMEVVVQVSVADVKSGSLRTVCDAYFMYVVLKTEEEKASQSRVEVPGLVPHTAEEHLEYGLADLRRNFRKKRDQQVEQLLKPSDMAALTEKPNVQSGSKVSFTELVLPYHANHMGNTFGGQIMSWMVKGAKTAIWLHLRLCCTPSDDSDDSRRLVGVGGAPAIKLEQLHDAWLRPVSVDTIHFKAPSHVGDRVNVTARVSRAFENSIEVAVRVTSNSVDTQDDPNEVNAGYLTFAVHSGDAEINSSILDVVPSTVEQDDEHRRAVARQQFRELRRQETKKASKIEGDTGFTVNLNPEGSQAQEVAVQCISCILSLQKRRDLCWECLPDDGGHGIKGWVEFDAKRPGSISRLKLQATIKSPPRACYDLLRNVSRRTEFDISCLEFEYQQPCGPTADLVRMVFASPNTGACSPSQKMTKREALLLRAYQEDPEHNTFILCSRSVRCDSRPLDSDHSRGELLPSGYIIEESPGGNGMSSELTFLGQFSNELFDLVQPHVRGSTHKFREIVEREALKIAEAIGGYPEDRAT